MTITNNYILTVSLNKIKMNNLIIEINKNTKNTFIWKRQPAIKQFNFMAKKLLLWNIVKTLNFYNNHGILYRSVIIGDMQQ